jgi:uncharacterized protein
MRIGVTGASGFIGGAVVAEILANNHGVVGFSRSPNRSIPGCPEVREFSENAGLDLTGLDALIHLAGEPIVGTWNSEKKAEILNSRIRSTERIVKTLWGMNPQDRPKTFACASAVGIYGDRGDEWLDEESDAGFGFLCEVTRQWEAAALKARDLGIRTVLLRIGFVVGARGGALPIMKKIFSRNLGGNLGNGKQWMPWIHIDDVAHIICHCVDDRLVSGAINLTAPEPVRNRDFTRVLADCLGRRAFLPAPRFMIRALPGGMHEMFLNSMRVDPTVMKSHGYQWQFPTLDLALRDCLDI